MTPKHYLKENYSVNDLVNWIHECAGQSFIDKCEYRTAHIVDNSSDGHDGFTIHCFDNDKRLHKTWRLDKKQAVYVAMKWCTEAIFIE